LVTYIMLFAYQANVSMYIKSSGLGNVTTAGYANTIFVFAGMLTGLVFGKFRAKLGFKTMQVGIGAVALGFFGIRFFGTLPAVFFSSFCTGIGQAFVIPSAILAVSAYTSESVRATGISITMGLLNFGMFISPSILNPIANILAGGDLRFKYMIAGICLLVLIVVHTALAPVFYKNKDELYQS
jgi:MFS family permease